MSTPRDPYASYLQKAAQLFEAGDVVPAGQIWQAVLKKVPNHAEARAGLYKVKLYFDARATQDGLGEIAATVTAPPAAPAPAPPEPTVDPEVARLLEQGCTLYDAGHLPQAVEKWEQVLAREPGNTLARGYIVGAKRLLGQADADATTAIPVSGDGPRATTALPQGLYAGTGLPPVPLAAPAQAPPRQAPSPTPAADDETLDRLLRDGCTLFDMGELQGALAKWEQLLALCPTHALALGYVADARRELGLAPGASAPAPPPAPAPTAPPAPAVPTPRSAGGELTDAERERLDQLIREGTQLYDMGMTVEATQKWEQALIMAPEHPDAAGYLAMAQRDAERHATAPPPTAGTARPAAPSAPKPFAAQEELLKKAERLLQQGRADEAAFLFQQVVDEAPHNFRALQGLHQAQGLKAAQEAHHAHPAPPAADMEEAPEAEPLPAAPPPDLITAPATTRKGVEVPELLRQTLKEVPAPLKRPAVLAGIAGGILLLNLGVWGINRYRREVRLKESVESFRVAALQTVARSVQIPSLAETPGAIRQEAESMLSEDPLRALYRAQEAARLEPTDPATAQLVERARAALASGEAPPAGSAKELDKLLDAGELDQAARILRTLLRQTPDDEALKARYARLCLALAQIHASKERWGDAQDALRQGRALYPGDRAWQVRLILLEHLRGLSGQDRAAWVQALG